MNSDVDEILCGSVDHYRSDVPPIRLSETTEMTHEREATSPPVGAIQYCIATLPVGAIQMTKICRHASSWSGSNESEGYPTASPVGANRF